MADRRHRAVYRTGRGDRPVFRTGRRHLSPVRTAGEGDPRTAPAPPHRAGPRRDWRRAEGTVGQDRGISLDPRRPAQALPGHAGRARGDPRTIRDTPHLRNRACMGRSRRRRPDRAGGHGRHRHPRRLHQAHAATVLPRAGARRQGPQLDGDQGRGCGGRDVRHQHPQPCAVLHQYGPRLSHEGVEAARR